MGTAVADDEGVPLTAIIAYKDAIGRWSVTVNDGPSSPTGIGRGEVNEDFEPVLERAKEDLRGQLKRLAQVVCL